MMKTRLEEDIHGPGERREKPIEVAVPYFARFFQLNPLILNRMLLALGIALAFHRESRCCRMNLKITLRGFQTSLFFPLCPLFSKLFCRLVIYG